MAISSKHPSYTKRILDWQLCRDCYEGEREVKLKGTEYLPATSGQIADGITDVNSVGYQSYNAYKTRAAFPDFMSLAVETAIGIMWSKPPVIELPKAMEPMLEKATTKGEGLMQLLRRINEQQLVTGRLGLLADLPEKPDPARPFPYIAMYVTEDIINWDEGLREQVIEDSLNLVVLDETSNERQANFEWKLVQKYRVLVLGATETNEEAGVYKSGMFSGQNAIFSEEGMIIPSIRGNTLEKIPFVFINGKDIIAQPDNPPLLGLAKLIMTIYRGEADYRQSLFMQGQDTLVIIGGQQDGDQQRVGAGAQLALPIGGDAKYIGVSSTGISEQRQAIEADKKDAASKAGQLIDTSSKSKESGEALKTRIAAQTATLNQIAQSGAEGLKSILRTIAEWMGANPDEVVVTPNLEFADESMTGKDLIDFMTAKTMGAPISLQTIHNMLQDKDVTEYSFEDEVALIQDEVPLITPPTPPGNGGGNNNFPPNG